MSPAAISLKIAVATMSMRLAISACLWPHSCRPSSRSAECAREVPAAFERVLAGADSSPSRALVVERLKLLGVITGN
jgi:hypothetical protein